MAEQSLPKNWTGLDLSSLCRIFTQDASGTQRRMGNKSQAIKRLVDALNHCLARQARPLFWRSAAYPSSTGQGWSQQSENPLYQWKMPDIVDNETTWRYRILCVPRHSGSGASDAHREGDTSTTTAEDYFIASSAQNLDAVEYVEFEYERGAVSDSDITEGITTTNNYTIVDICVQVKPLVSLNTDDHLYVLPTVAPGDYITGDTILESIRSRLHELRTTNTPIVFCWCSTDIGNTSITASDSRGFYTVSTSFVNILDQSVTSRSATSPGFSFHTQYAGMGLEVPTGGTATKIKVTYRVYADIAANSGTVRFETRVGTSDITINSGGAAWYGSDSDYFEFYTNVADTETGIARNKCDIFFKTASGDALRVWAITCWVIQ